MTAEIVCPNCGSTHVYYGGTECASCEWHEPNCTTFHRNFSYEPDCVWCNSAIRKDSF